MTETSNIRVSNRIVAAAMVTMALAVFICFYAVIRDGRYEDDSVVVTGLYDVVFNGEEYNQVDIKAFDFPSIKKGNHVEYSFVMPDDYVEDAVLTLYLDHAAVKVYYDDVMVYSKGSPKSRMLGYGYVHVNLPDDYAGMRVTIALDAIEDEGLSSLAQPVIHNGRTYIHNFILDNLLYLIIDIAIIMLCMTLVILAFVFSRLVSSLEHLAYFGMAFFLMGLYELCSYNLISIFSDSLILKGYVEYSTLYLGPFFLTIYFYKEIFVTEIPKLKNAYRLMMILQGVYPVVAFILHFTDVIHLPGVLRPFHALLLVNIVIMLIALIRTMIRKDTTHRYMIIGLMFLVLLAMTDMLRFNILFEFMRKQMQGYVSYLLVGFFFFLITMIIDFFVNQRERLYKSAHDEAVAKLASVDMMTDLANRRGCEEVFDELRKSDKTFGIICFDINFLKVANDRYGHQEGDRLLIDFAHLLKEACDGVDAVPGRMGGDEFMLIVPEAEGDVLDQVMDKLNRLRDEVNENRKKLPISYAYGCCLSDDAGIRAVSDPGDLVEMVYNIADERMYEHKTAMKVSR